MDRNSLDYNDSCPDCDGLDLAFSNEEEVGDQLHFLVLCRECGSEWQDIIDYWDFD